MNYGLDYQGGGSGGGGGGGFQQPDSASRRSGRPSSDEQTILPVTISMIMSAASEDGGGDAALQLTDGRKLHHVKIVGAVRSVEDLSTNVLYQIEDGTGLIDVKQWNDTSDCTAVADLRQLTMKEHIYVKIVGQVKDYNGNKMIVSESVRPLSTGNELSHHMLDVIYTAETYKRKSQIIPPMSTGVGFGSSVPLTAKSNMGSGDAAKDRLMNFIRDEADNHEHGASIHHCMQLFGGRLSEAEIRRLLDELSAEGHVYSTCNEDHYKSAMA